MTLGNILENSSESYPEKTAIIFGNVKIKYSELNTMVNKLANHLLNMGIKKGDIVSLLLFKSPEAVISFLAIAKIGAIVAPLNYKAKLDEFQLILNSNQSSGLIIDSAFLSQTQTIISANQTLKGKIIVAGQPISSPYTSWAKVVNNGDSTPPAEAVNENDIVYLNYTSGTTGIPKGAVTTHANILWNTISAVETLKLKPSDVHLCMFPVSTHPHELFARSIYLGGTLVLLDAVYPKSIAQSITNHKITCMMGVSPIYETLLPFANSLEFDFSFLRLAESGGMITRTDLQEKFSETFGLPITPVWGSTETTGIAFANPSNNGKPVPESMGRLCLHYQAKIIDENGQELPPNHIGEIIVKGPAIVSGYYNRPEETNKTFKDGWFYTSDLARKDEDGFFYFTDRKNGMMKVAGMKVYPLEIENVLYTHPKIAEAVVISAEEKLHGEVPKAVIVLKNGEEASQKEIRNFCQESLPNYKIPRIIEFKDSLPKTESGKITKKVLIEAAKKKVPEINIEDYQRMINKIDLNILQLLNKRAKITQDSLALKKQKGTNLFAPDREEEIIQNVIGHNNGPFHDESIEEIFRKIINSSIIL